MVDDTKNPSPKISLFDDITAALEKTTIEEVEEEFKKALNNIKLKGIDTESSSSSGSGD